MDQNILIYVLLGGLAIGLLICLYTDIRHRLILNAVTGPIALAAPLYWYAVGEFNLESIGFHLLICALFFCIFLIPFRLGMMGGGDVKLFSALALWFNWIWVMRLMLYASLIGGVLTIIFWGIHKVKRREGRVWTPYGIAISLTGLWVISQQNFNHFG
jgi:prepilin peptidase CpaA